MFTIQNTEKKGIDKKIDEVLKRHWNAGMGNR